jgi:hypothetical protein
MIANRPSLSTLSPCPSHPMTTSAFSSTFPRPTLTRAWSTSSSELPGLSRACTLSTASPQNTDGPDQESQRLEDYLLIESSLFSKNSTLHHFRIRHPDLQPNDVIVSTSSDSNRLKFVGLLDWQHASDSTLISHRWHTRYLSSELETEAKVILTRSHYSSNSLQ